MLILIRAHKDFTDEIMEYHSSMFKYLVGYSTTQVTAIELSWDGRGNTKMRPVFVFSQPPTS